MAVATFLFRKFMVLGSLRCFGKKLFYSFFRQFQGSLRVACLHSHSSVLTLQENHTSLARLQGRLVATVWDNTSRGTTKPNVQEQRTGTIQYGRKKKTRRKKRQGTTRNTLRNRLRTTEHDRKKNTSNKSVLCDCSALLGAVAVHLIYRMCVDAGVMVMWHIGNVQCRQNWQLGQCRIPTLLSARANRPNQRKV